MFEIPIELEVERVMNLVRGFGWEKTEEQFDGESIFIKIKKKKTVAEPGIPS